MAQGFLEFSSFEKRAGVNNGVNRSAILLDLKSRFNQ
jgi:hypothetical protein